MLDLGTPFPGLQCEARGIEDYMIPWGAGTCCEVFNPQTLECEGEGSRAFEFRSSGSGWIAQPSLATRECVAASAFSVSKWQVAGGCQRLAEWQMNAGRWTPFNTSGTLLQGTVREIFSVVKAQAPLGKPKDNQFQYAGNITSPGGTRGFYYRPGYASFRPIGTLGGSVSEANGVNSMGAVVGVSETSSGERHAFFLVGALMRDLGTLGGKMSVATGINDRYQVVGYTEAYSTFVPFLWTPSQGMVMLQPPDGATGCAAFAINNKGVVVGTCAMPGPGSPLRATMWVLK